MSEYFRGQEDLVAILEEKLCPECCKVLDQALKTIRGQRVDYVRDHLFPDLPASKAKKD